MPRHRPSAPNPASCSGAHLGFISQIKSGVHHVSLPLRANHCVGLLPALPQRRLQDFEENELFSLLFRLQKSEHSLGPAADIELLIDLFQVVPHGFVTDLEIGRCLLGSQSSRQEFEDLPFARRE